MSPRAVTFRTLLLEDDPLDAELMLRELAAAGLVVDARRVEGRDAFFAAVDEEPPADLFLIDYQVPGIEAPEALAFARARRPGVPVIVISGKVGEEIAIEMLKAGATDYVLKQRLGRLAPAVERALRERALVQQKRETEARLDQVTAELEQNGLIASVFEQLQSAVVVAEVPSGRVLLANARAEEVLGPAVRSIAGVAEHGRLVLRRRGGHRYAVDELPLVRAIRRDEIVRDEPAEFVRRDGAVGYLLVSAARLRDRRGHGRAAICVLTEVTEQARLSVALERQREQLGSVLAAAVDDAIIGADPAGTIEIFNVGAERMLGYAAADVVGRLSIAALHDPEEVAARALDLGVAPGFAVLAESARRGLPPRDWTYLRRDGARVPVSLSLCVRRHGAAGEIAGYVSVARDLSALRRAEAERASSRAREQGVRAQLDAVFDAMPVGLAIVDPELRFERVNPVIAARTGVPAEAHAGHPLRDLLPASITDALEPAMRRVLETGAPVLDLELSGFPSAERHCLTNLFPVQADGRTVALGVVSIDISERRRMEDALRRTAEFRERFLGIASHDLRSPLQVILGSVEGALMQPGTPEALRPALERAARNGRQMARMIGDLLDVTRADLGGGIPIKPCPIDLRAHCARTLDELRAVHPDRAVSLTSAPRIEACVDPDRFAQIVVNLVVNALKHGSRDAPVRVALRAAGGRVELEVCNQGPPIPAELMPRLFDAFARGPAAGEGAVGLGLFIVREIARAHGGHVDVRRSAEEETCFQVSLPKGGAEMGTERPQAA